MSGGNHARAIGRSDHRPEATPVNVRNALTDEQSRIVTHDPSGTLIVEAFAGTGKTSTLVEYAKKWKSKGLYLCFNSSIASEAKVRFRGTNVTARTAHSYASQALGVSRYNGRLVNKIRRQHIREAGISLGNLYVSEERMMKALLEALTSFMIDQGAELQPYHCGLQGLTDRSLDSVMPILSSVVERFINFQTSDLPFTHDIYLKHLEMFGGISKEYDYLLIDEAQDLNPVLISLVKKSGLPAIIVGDPFQSIYAFRGAVSAMRMFDAPRLPLSQSWRFGSNVADVANHILTYVSEPPERPIVGRPEHETVVERYSGSAPPKCFILARTNARLFEGLINIHDKPFHVAGGFGPLASQLLSAYHLSRAEMYKVTDQFVRQFSSWQEFSSEAEDGDPDAKRLSSLISEHGNEIPALIDRLKVLAREKAEDAYIILSTAHKAKGLEADVVVMLDDFETPRDLKEKMLEGKTDQITFDQECHLLYVGVTRAKKRLLLADRLFDAFHPHIGDGNTARAPLESVE
ncbi:UvrD-helicase domain-containing protein [Sphingomonas sp. 3-13AW]|uniref:UvrD-helicase domain-containing protein n=1 Tax=Sphingomonas sp. 3-13AW TaxID=3050450 RepID=UPI003BB556E7